MKPWKIEDTLITSDEELWLMRKAEIWKRELILLFGLYFGIALICGGIWLRFFGGPVSSVDALMWVIGILMAISLILSSGAMWAITANSFLLQGEEHEDVEFMDIHTIFSAGALPTACASLCLLGLLGGEAGVWWHLASVFVCTISIMLVNLGFTQAEEDSYG